MWVPGMNGGIYAALKRFPGYDVIVFRGSDSLEDWFRDFKAFPIDHPLLGGIERGFAEGMDNAFASIIQKTVQPLVVTGHSLGAARAYIFAGLCAVKKIPVAKVTVFGSPRPGFSKLKDILSDTEIESYRNGDDPVPDVPLTVLPLFPYIEPAPFIFLNESPVNGDDPVAWHNIALYAAGVKNLSAA
jgi:predicted lipase